MSSFIHLRVHTEYSLLDSIIKIDDLVERATKLKMPAVGITEYQNLFSAIKAYKACRNAGIKPLIGVELAISDAPVADTSDLVVLICQNNEGFKALSRLLTKAHQRIKNGGDIALDRRWLTEANCRGLIALSAGLHGEVGRHLLTSKNDHAVRALNWYRAIFPDRFYLEVSRFGEQSETFYNDAALDLGEHTNTPVVATHQPRFIRQQEYEFHELRVTIHDQQVGGVNNVGRRSYTDEQYFCTAEQMADKFADVPAVIENSFEIARRCNLHLELNTATHMPAYGTDSQDFDINVHLRKESYDGLERLLQGTADQRYRDRLEHELSIIEKTNFAGYFLIVSDIIRWAKTEGVSVGPGRGSGAGSLVAFCLDITTVDPIRHGLIFERFLTPDRISPPDFDIDFCVWQREKIIEHVTSRYGMDQVAQIITYQTMAARAAVKNVGRAIRPDYLFYDQVAKLIPNELNITLAQALERSSELKERYDNESRIKELIDSSMILEGLVLNVGKHPAGLVIAPSTITDFAALMADTESGRDTTHFDKDDLEDIGLVKFDFLGLRTLTIIALAIRNINARLNPDEPLSEYLIPEDDEATYKYISSARTMGVFQLESAGMQRLIHEMKPSEFSHLVALVALYRPGPMQTGMDDMYIENQRRGSYEVPHPSLKEVLDESHGVILYQEQVMKIAQLMSGYTLAEADILRKAMGKKLKKEMHEQRKRFVDGAVEKGYEQKLAGNVYDLIESFGGYGFNKSHSVAYAVLSYRTAYLKTHYMTDYLAAYMSVDMDVKTVAKLCTDAKAHEIEVLPPDINQSIYNFTALNERQILYGLGALKRIGKAVVESIENTRQASGRFKDLTDFCMRNDLQVVTKNACEALICAGAFDSLNPKRGELLNQLNHVYGVAQRRVEDESFGQVTLFDNDSAAKISQEEVVTTNGAVWSSAQLLTKEYEILGLYLTGHPTELYADELSTLGVRQKLVSIGVDTQGEVTVAGSIRNRHLVERRGETRAYFEIEDASGQLSIAVYNDIYSKYRDRIVENAIAIITGQLENPESGVQQRLRASRVLNLDTVRQSTSARVVLRLRHGSTGPDAIAKLKKAMTAQPGERHRVHVEYMSANGTIVPYRLNESWRVTVTDDFITNLRAILGDRAVLVDHSTAPARG